MADTNSATASSMNGANNSKPHLIFTYGTLKQGFPNHHLMQDLISKDDAALLGTYSTHNSYPMVHGRSAFPISSTNLGQVIGSGASSMLPVSSRGLVRLDELESISVGHYERLPIQAADGTVSLEAEAYFAHSNFGERLWKKNGEVGIMEYTEEDATKYVRKENRPKGRTLTDVIDEFLNS